MKIYNIFLLYNTAILSFLASIFRDYLIINNTDYSLIFFKIIYICSVASVIPINYISYSKNPPSRIILYLLSLISVVVIFYLCKINFNEYFNYFLYGAAIFLLWIIGSIYSQFLFINGFIFISKSRESLASLLTAIFIIFLNINLIFLFLIAVLLSLITLIIISNYKSNSLKLKSFKMVDKNLINFDEIFKIILSNISIVSILLWALYFSTSDLLYGYPAEYIIRGSMYLFQALVIGSSLILVIENKRILNFRYTFFISIILLPFGFILSIFNLHIGVFLMPVICVLLHYLNVHFLNSK